MSCQIETVSYPVWWDDANTVRVFMDPTVDGLNHTFARSDIELLPQGVSAPSVLFPWSYVIRLERVN